MEVDVSRTLKRRPATGLLRQGCLLLLLGVFLLCLVVSSLVTGALLSNGPVVAVVAFLLATATTLPYGLLLLWIDRNEQEPILLVLMAFLWGANVATAVSLVFNTAFGILMVSLVEDPTIADQLTASLSAPFIEELTKGSAVMLLFVLFRRHFDNVLDGMLYGAFIGLGFAWFENVLYYAEAGSEGPVSMLKLTYLRGILNGVTSHAAYTALTGLGFGLVRVVRRGLLRWGLVPLFLGLAMFAHFAWNTLVGPVVAATGAQTELSVYLGSLPLAVALLQAPFVLLLSVVAVASWQHEATLIVRYLANEPVLVVAPGEAVRLVPARTRLALYVDTLFRAGPLHTWRLRRMQQDQIKLAFVKWHHDRDEETTWPYDQDADVIALRDRIRRRRSRLG
ncbi:MAG: PrsW family intramembrane metalloprotease [Myxococcota bacterium]|nr:PrsW family intramembrane metalloprotease [Myxococcota bacterium]